MANISKTDGVLSRRIHDTPIAIIDFETTGLTPGLDRVVEISVVRIDPDEKPRLVFDTLVNPRRPMAATEIHGITDADVTNAPAFEDIAGEFVAAMTGCVVAAYNVYFDIKFLRYELGRANVSHEPPHFCLMYMRPMLGLGKRCKLSQACRDHGIDYSATHIAANDAQAAAGLLENYFCALQTRDIQTYSQLAAIKNYKFVSSWSNSPLPDPSAFSLGRCDQLCSRAGHVDQILIDPVRKALGEYWDALKTVVADLEISPDEIEYIVAERKRLGLAKEQLRVLHARAFSSAIAQFVDDQWLDDREVLKLRKLKKCLNKLGWAPGD